MKIGYVLYLCFTCVVATVRKEENEDLDSIQYKQQLEIQITATRPTTGLIEKYFYPARIHRVTTDDGYILEVHRVPSGLQDSTEGPHKPVVLLQHGLFGSSADWLLMGPKYDLAYKLADLGYDVWLGNSRGNVYSRQHETMDSNLSTPYWDFTWHEMGRTDLPTVIDYILDKTGQDHLFYVGHSQGTTQFYVMASERPEYNDKIKAMFSLAPMAFMDHTRSPLWQVLAGVEDNEEVFQDLVGSGKLLPSARLYQMIGEGECNETAITPLMCHNIMFLMAGFDARFVNKTMIPVILGHTPMGVAVKQLRHYSQLVNSGMFRQFDRHLENLVHYGRTSPPEYDLGKVTCPVVLMYGEDDLVVHPKDVRRLHKRLVNSNRKTLVPLKNFGHLDFLWSTEARFLVYDYIVDLMETFE